MSTIHILHENPEWTAPLIMALEARGRPYRDWFLNDGSVDLSAEPPAGIFYSRMSASSHTRGHRYAPELTAAVLKWLEHSGRTVLNGSRALALEISKVAQYTALADAGVPVPRTIAAVGAQAIVDAWDAIDGPVITKHNRAGKGLGVRLFRNRDALREYALGNDFDPSVDGITLIQQYIQAPDPCIIRVEMVGREFVYAVRVDTSGGFELCPADVCEIEAPTCMIDGSDGPVGNNEEQPEKFEILEGVKPPFIAQMQQLMRANDIHVAGFEYIVDDAGKAYVYDINTNTNYNSAAEKRAGISAMDRLAAYLDQELAASASLETGRPRQQA
ncbi:MAG: alpha-L-glutamate ligase [Alphaproteobacteria bacterium]|nr:alpha-L-glutamate ligase [Alphaproteobacteria bacterium]